MLYSSACEYAIRALTYIEAHEEIGFISVAEIAEVEELPASFLGKICKDLVRGGILRSARGPTGGYALAVPADQVSVLRIREVIDGVDDLHGCAVGLNPCSDATPCPLHDTWKPLRLKLETFLRTTTLADMAEGVRKKRALRAAAEAAGP